MCSLQIEVIRGTSACTRTSLQFRAIKRFVSSKHGRFPSYLYSFSNYALLGYILLEVNNLAQRDLLVKRNSFSYTVRAFIVNRKFFFFLVRVNKVVLDCMRLTENNVLPLQWDVMHQNCALWIMNSSASCNSLSTTYLSVINMLNELIRTIRTFLLVSGL